MSTTAINMDIKLVGDRVLRVVAFLFLIGNGISTFFLSHSYHEQLKSPSASSTRWESVDFLANSDSVYWDQKLEFLLLGIFTLVLMLANIIRGSTIQVCEYGPFIICLGYLCSAINFFVMREQVCDKECLKDIMKDAKDSDEDKWEEYLYDQLEDKASTLVICSVIAGIGFYITLVGYYLAWNEKTTSCAKALVFFAGMNATPIGFIGAFVKYFWLINKLDHGEYTDLPGETRSCGHRCDSNESDDFDEAQNHVTGFLILAGVGFVLAGIGELSSICTINGKSDAESGDVEDPAQGKKPQSVEFV